MLELVQSLGVPMDDKQIISDKLNEWKNQGLFVYIFVYYHDTYNFFAVSIMLKKSDVVIWILSPARSPRSNKL